MHQSNNHVQAVLPTNGKQLQLVELGMPADSQVISYQYLTRAKHSLAHVTLDELEETLQLPEERLLPLEEGEEYENFLQALQNNFDDLPEDDEEDIDFVLDDLLDSDREEWMATTERRSPHPSRVAAKQAMHNTDDAGMSGQLPAQQDAVPNEVLGVPACMVPAEQFPADFVDQLYESPPEEPALPAEMWFPEQPCHKAHGFDAAQIKQLYRQLNQHCQLMIQVYALTACNSQHQQTAISVKELLEEYQGITAQMLDSGVDQMPHGKRYDAPYPPQLLGLASSVVTPDSGNSPEPAPTAPEASLAATANQPRHQEGPGQQQPSGIGSLGSQVTLTQHDADTAGQAQSAEQHLQQQPRQQAERNIQALPSRQTDSIEAAAPAAVSSVQAADGAAGSSRPVSPAGTVSRPGSARCRRPPWAPSCCFDVHSILEVSSMQLVPDFFEEIDKIPADAQPEQLDIAEPTTKKAALKKANRLPPPLVPPEVKQAVACFQEHFDPELFPKFQALPAQMTWTQGEDELLAAGLLRFGLEWSLIMKHLIPIKTIVEIRDRQKNRCHRVEGNIIRTAKEHITRPLEEEEVAAITKGIEYLEYNWDVQRSLEDEHGLKDSSHDSRMQPLNRWRLLPYIPQLGLQSRGGMVLYQMYDEATGRKPKTTRTGAAPGALNRLSKNPPPEPASIQPAFMEDGASPPKPQQRKHGGPRHVVLDPPMYLLFADPVKRPAEEDVPAVVAGRVAKIRKPPPPQTARQTARAAAAAAAAAIAADRQTLHTGSGSTHGASIEVAEGIPVYPVGPRPPNHRPAAQEVLLVEGQSRPPGSAGLIGNPFRVQVPDIPTSHAQVSMPASTQLADGMPMPAAETSAWQQTTESMQQNGHDLGMDCDVWHDDAEAAYAGAHSSLGLDQHQQQVSARQADARYAHQPPTQASSQQHSSARQPPLDYAAALAKAAGFTSSTRGTQHGRPAQPSLSASASAAEKSSGAVLGPQQAPSQALPITAALPILAEPRLQDESRSTALGGNPSKAHDPGANGPDTGEVFEQDQLSQSSDGHDTDTDTDANLYSNAVEVFDQDQLSQPASSQDDEDFEPDCLSQPDSTTEDEVELDEMSQPSSSDSDEEAAQGSSQLKRKANFAHPLVHRSGSQGQGAHRTPSHAAGVMRCQTNMSQPAPHQPGCHKTPGHATLAATKHAAPAPQQTSHAVQRSMLEQQGGAERCGQKRTREEEHLLARSSRPRKSFIDSPPVPRSVMHTAPHHRLAEPEYAAGQQQKQATAAQHKSAAAATGAAAPRLNAAAGAHPQKAAMGPAAGQSFSFRKRPRKPARPKCAVSGAVPEPPESLPVQQPRAVPNKQGHALRPRQGALHSWGAKGRRTQRSRRTNAAISKSRGAGAGVQKPAPVRPRVVSDAQDHQQKGNAATCNVSPESDAQLKVDGVWTQWSDEDDRAIVLECMIRHKGFPSQEVYTQLVDTLQQSGSLFTVRQVQARFECLVNRLLQNLPQNSQQN